MIYINFKLSEKECFVQKWFMTGNFSKKRSHRKPAKETTFLLEAQTDKCLSYNYYLLHIAVTFILFVIKKNLAQIFSPILIRNILYSQCKKKSVSKNIFLLLLVFWKQNIRNLFKRYPCYKYKIRHGRYDFLLRFLSRAIKILIYPLYAVKYL